MGLQSAPRSVGSPADEDAKAHEPALELGPIRVHIAGGNFLTRLGLGQLFASAGFIEVSGISRTETEAIRRLQMERPDIAVVDTEIGTESCHTVLQALKLSGARTRVIILASLEALSTMDSFVEAGVSSFLDKRCMLEDIASIIRVVNAGGVVFSSPPQNVRGSSIHRGTTPQSERFHALNARDRRIVQAIASGLTNGQIGNLLHISEATVKAHLAQIMRSVGIDNRVQLAVAADNAGLFDVTEVADPGSA
ncbi:LuxR C-terminal-related transcriptional regulator [Psychromicrobium sp. YIM B11713]|uniref:LuxR C-terminal-related transcriptional regulator n=1 Tax=Psychromicrobium sp. YIM B11713 TaxID=3145233 RepID=UPI00374F85E0